MKTALITGATGYLGSHICELLVTKGYKVYAICRDGSDFTKCTSFFDKVIWVNQSKVDLSIVVDDSLDLLIHCAWTGVSQKDRNDWDVQLNNFFYSKVIFDLALIKKVKKIICLGSQAEYGIFTKKISEVDLPMPTEAYGSVKFFTLNYLRNLLFEKDVEWYWLRVFSVLGGNENSNWLIPTVIKSLNSNQDIELTEGEQYYDYLMINEFVKKISLVIESKDDKSGVYNICSGNGCQIKELLIEIAMKMNKSIDLLKFGRLPYRKNQNKFIVGNPTKFNNAFQDNSENIKNYINLIIK